MSDQVLSQLRRIFLVNCFNCRSQGNVKTVQLFISFIYFLLHFTIAYYSSFLNEIYIIIFLQNKLIVSKFSLCNTFQKFAEYGKLRYVITGYLFCVDNVLSFVMTDIP